jgi:hypothetical protein
MYADVIISPSFQFQRTIQRAIMRSSAVRVIPAFPCPFQQGIYEYYTC